MPFKLVKFFYCNPSFVVVLFTVFLPYIYSNPVPVTETLYSQFIQDLTENNCHIPSGQELPFVNCTDSIQCLSSAFKQCDTKESIKPKEKAFLLCTEIFDNLDYLFCKHDKTFEVSKVGRPLSTQLCEDFSHLNTVVPKKEQYLGSRLIDTVVCSVVCSNKFEFLCRILLWTYEVQNLMKASNIEPENVEQDAENISLNELNSDERIPKNELGNEQTNSPAHQQQKDVNFVMKIQNETVPIVLKQKSGADMDSESDVNAYTVKVKVVEVIRKPSHATVEPNNTTIKNGQSSSSEFQNVLTNTISVNEPSAPEKVSSSQIHTDMTETGSIKNHYVVRVKVMPNKISSSSEILKNLSETNPSGNAASVKNNENNENGNQNAENEGKKSVLLDSKLPTFGRTNEDNNEGMLGKANAINEQNLYIGTQPNVDVNNENNKIPEMKSNPDIQGQNTDAVGNGDINLQITDIGSVQNGKDGFTNSQTDANSKVANNAEHKDSIMDEPVKNQNISNQEKVLDITSKQNIKDVGPSSNNLNIKTTNGNEKFKQDTASTDTPLEKMDDSDDHQPADQDQYNVAVYQRTKSNEPESKVPNVADIPTETKNDFPKTFDEFPPKTSILHGSEDIQVIPSFPEQEDSHFIFYFLSIVFILMVGYVIFHNKQKIIALIVEGRHERRRRSHGVGYKKLETK